MENNFVLITGSAKGLGKELALVFASHNYNIILHDKKEEDLKEIEKQVLNQGVDCCSVAGDLKLEETLDKLYKISKEKGLAILINNAGVHCPGLAFQELNDNQIDDLLLTNLVAPIKLTKKVYTLFLENSQGTIININSVCGLEVHKLRTVFSSSKWGLRGFSDILRLEAEENNIRVIDIYPSRIKTRPEYTKGMEPREVAQNIYQALEKSNSSKIILDDRSKKKKKVLICGATGFLGRNLVERFIQKDDLEVYATYLEPGFFHPKAKMIQADLTKKEDVDRAVQGMDIIIQAAATTSGAKDIINNPAYHVTDNAVMNSLIFRAAFEHKVSHIISFSCTEMYQSSNIPLKETDFDANQELYPKYFGPGWTKIYTEKMAEFYSRIGKGKYTVIRHSNVYGPYDKFDLERSHVFGATITKVMTNENRKIVVWGTGQEERDLLYVSDLLDFVELALNKQETKFELFNVGSANSISITDLVKKIIKVSGKDLEIEYDQSKPTIKTKLCLDSSKAKKILGWSPKISLDEGIKKTIDWYKNNI